MMGPTNDSNRTTTQPLPTDNISIPIIIPNKYIPKRIPIRKIQKQTEIQQLFQK